MVVRRVQALLQMGSKCSYTIFEQHENKIVMWGLQSNQLRMIKWKGIILEQQSNQLRRIKIERDYPKLISYLFS
jgi:hypothetical protein